MNNSTYNPQNIADFEKAKLIKNAIGVSQSCTASTTTSVDLVLTDDHLLMGANLLAKGANEGDTVSFQVLMGSTVLAQFVTTWYVNPDETAQITPQSNFPAKVITGLTLRVEYTSTGSTPVWVAVNYDLLKVLV